MSTHIKRVLNDLTNENKRFKNDFILNIGELDNQKCHSSYSTSLSSESLIEDDSVFDDDVFEDQPNITGSLLKTSQNQSRKRLNGTSTYRHKRKNKFTKKENIVVDQTLNQLREEQARIDAHSLSILTKGI